MMEQLRSEIEIEVWEVDQWQLAMRMSAGVTATDLAHMGTDIMREM